MAGSASSSLLDSTAAFRERVGQLGLEPMWAAFENRGWITMGAFAFASSFSANASDNDRWVAEVLVPIVGEAGNMHPSATLVRRLYFECFTAATADLRRRVSRTDDDPPPKMPNAEREQRREATSRRLAGLDVSGELEPSDELIDLCAGMLESNALSYIPWDRCTTYAQQCDRPAGEPLRREWKTDAQGYLKETSAKASLTADLGSHTRAPELRLQNALTRRAIAMDIAGLMTYDVGAKVVTYLMKRLLMTPPDPRYEPPSLDQIRRADLHIWRELAKACRRGVRRGPSSTLPLDEAVGEVLRDQDLALIVQCLPRAPKSGGGGGGGGGGNRAADQTPSAKGSSRAQRRREAFEKKKRELEQLAKTAADAEAAAKAPRRDAQPKCSGKGVRLPPPLMGKCHMTHDKKSCCFGFNMGTCPAKDVAPGQRCDRGWHVCMEPVNGHACGRPHPVSEH